MIMCINTITCEYNSHVYESWPLLSVFILILHCRTGNNHRMGLETHWVHPRHGPELSLHWSPDPHEPLLCQVGPSDTVSFLKLVSIQYR